MLYIKYYRFLIGTYVMFVNLFASSLKFLSQTKSIERLSSLRKTVANSYIIYVYYMYIDNMEVMR